MSHTWIRSLPPLFMGDAPFLFYISLLTKLCFGEHPLVPPISCLICRATDLFYSFNWNFVYPLSPKTLVPHLAHLCFYHNNCIIALGLLSVTTGLTSIELPWPLYHQALYCKEEDVSLVPKPTSNFELNNDDKILNADNIKWFIKGIVSCPLFFAGVLHAEAAKW